MRAIAVVGLGFGDEGKGATTDFLVRKYRSPLVVRFNGGPQAAHNVVTPDGLHHTFSQFGAGTLAGARTHLSRFMLIDPIALANEAAVLSGKGIDDPWSLITIDPQSVVITPYHVATNRMREAERGKERHGSVGMGVGEARRDELENGLAVRAVDLYDRDTCIDKLRMIWQAKKEEGFNITIDPEAVWERWQAAIPVNRSIVGHIDESLHLAKLIARVVGEPTTIVFEGAQGVLLDETHGFAPYNTWTDCTFNKAAAIANECNMEVLLKLGVIRTYYTRHGAGPFPTEHPGGGAGDYSLQERHNTTHPFMGKFRTGWFDLTLLKYACTVSRPNMVALTHCDVVPPQVAIDYGWVATSRLALPALPALVCGGNIEPVMEPLKGIVDLVNLIYAGTGGEVYQRSYGPTADHVRIADEVFA